MIKVLYSYTNHITIIPVQASRAYAKIYDVCMYLMHQVACIRQSVTRLASIPGRRAANNGLVLTAHVLMRMRQSLGNPVTSVNYQ